MTIKIDGDSPPPLGYSLSRKVQYPEIAPGWLHTLCVL